MVTIKTLSTNLPFLPRFTLLPSLPQWCRRTGDGQLRVRSWSVCNISSLLPSPPHYCPTPAWGLLYGIQSLINCFEVDPPLAGVVLQHGSPVGHSSCQKLALAWALPTAASFRAPPSTCLVWALQGCHCGDLLQHAPQRVAGGEPASRCLKGLSC